MKSKRMISIMLAIVMVFSCYMPMNAFAGTKNSVASNEQTIVKSFKIDPLESYYVWEGVPIEPKVVIRDSEDDRILIENVDYRIEYENNDAIGTGGVRAHGIGEYVNCQAYRSFKIDIFRTFAMDDIKEEYDLGCKPDSSEIVVRDGEEILIEGVDYIVENEGIDDIGSCYVWVYGIGDYEGFEDHRDYCVVDNTPKIQKLKSIKFRHSFIYTGKKVDPISDIDYFVFGDYIDYDGYFTTDNVMSEDDHYEVVYVKNDINAGLGTIKIRGVNGVQGTLTANFKIKPRSINDKRVEICRYGDEIYGAISRTYTGKAQKIGGLEVCYKGNPIKKGKDYTVSYSNNVNTGIGKVVIKGKGNFTGTKEIKIQIKPKKAKIKSLKRGKKYFTVKYYKNTGKITGYQIKYAKNGSKKYKTKYSKGTSCKISGLKAKTTYKVQVRAYKKVGKKMIYGKWSSVKKVKTK